jgi:hypothetical protein
MPRGGKRPNSGRKPSGRTIRVSALFDPAALARLDALPGASRAEKVRRAIEAGSSPVPNPQSADSPLTVSGWVLSRADYPGAPVDLCSPRGDWAELTVDGDLTLEITADEKPGPYDSGYAIARTIPLAAILAAAKMLEER